MKSGKQKHRDALRNRRRWAGAWVLFDRRAKGFVSRARDHMEREEFRALGVQPATLRESAKAFEDGPGLTLDDVSRLQRLMSLTIRQ